MNHPQSHNGHSNQFRGFPHGTEIPCAWMCDGWTDCSDGSDEVCDTSTNQTATAPPTSDTNATASGIIPAPAALGVGVGVALGVAGAVVLVLLVFLIMKVRAGSPHGGDSTPPATAAPTPAAFENPSFQQSDPTYADVNPESSHSNDAEYFDINPEPSSAKTGGVLVLGNDSTSDSEDSEFEL